MKRFLLFVLLIAGVSACKKDRVSPENLIGNWQDEVMLASSMIPSVFSFRANGTYSPYSGQPPEEGTYQINKGSSTARVLDISLSGIAGSAPTMISVEITSPNRIIITYPGGTAGRAYVRRQ